MAQDAEAEGDAFAGGTDITAICLQVKVAMETMSALDIKSAFLNADLRGAGESGGNETTDYHGQVGLRGAGRAVAD